MKKIASSIVVITILLFSSIMLITFSENSQALGNEIFVDDNFYLYRDGTAEHPYKTIREALNVAQEGDTIYVFGGVYNETLNINKKVTIIGSVTEGNSVIKYGSAHKYTISITADYVNFTGFDVTDEGNAIISQINGALIHVTASNVIMLKNNITDCVNGWGIYIDESNNHLIKNNKIDNTINGIYAYSSRTNDFVDNVITNCSSSGIKIKSSYYNTLYGNTIADNVYGAYILDSDSIDISNNSIYNNEIRGVGIYRGKDCTINYNEIHDNVNQGLYLSSSNSDVYGNIVENNQFGIDIDASNCNIYLNFINDSSSSGIHTYAGTTGHIIYNNSFNGNAVNGFEQGNNKWYSSSLNIGNYWDDYNEIDRDNDGIGDVIYRKGGVYDKYPLGKFLGPPDKPKDPSPEDDEDNVGLKIKLTVKVTDPDREDMDVYFYRTYAVEDNIPDELLYIDYGVPSGSTASADSFNLLFQTNFLWYVIVNDSRLENVSDIWFFSTRLRPGSNIPPVADAGGPYSAYKEEEVVFDTSNSYDPDGEIEFYRWNFGDDTSEILSTSPTHTYYSTGVYDVTLTVIDDNGSSTNQVVEVTILSGDKNNPPVANAGGPYQDYTGKSILFESASYDPDGDGLYYEWDFGDNSENSALANPSHTYSKSGAYIVTLTVNDTRGGTSIATAEVTIKSKKPDESPGFEFIISTLAIIIIILLLKRKKNY